MFENNDFEWILAECFDNMCDGLYYRNLLGEEALDRIVPFIEYNICNYILKCNQSSNDDSSIKTTIDKIIAYDTNVALTKTIDWTKPYENQVELMDSHHCFDSTTLKMLYSAALYELESASLIHLEVCNFILDNDHYRVCTTDENIAILQNCRQALQALKCEFIDEIIDKDLQSEYIGRVSENIGKPVLSRLVIVHTKERYIKDYISCLRNRLKFIEDYYCRRHQYESFEHFDRMLPCICIGSGSDFPYTNKGLMEYLEEW